MMNFTDEMIAKAKQTASAEELLKLAEEEGIVMTAEEAEKYFSFLSADGELSDEALEAVAGGKGYTAKYYLGDTVQFWYAPKSTTLVGKITKMYTCEAQGWWLYDVKQSIGVSKGTVYGKLPLEDPSYQTQKLS